MAEDVTPVEPGMVHNAPAPGDWELIDAIGEHLERFFGEYRVVFHEDGSGSEGVHVDVHVVPPAPDRDRFTLVTSGMAERAMRAPEGFEDYRYGELVLALPSDWRLLAGKPFEDTGTYWPLWLLKDLARLPHDDDTFLFYGHTVGNGEPSSPYEGTAFHGSLLAGSRLAPEEFDELTLADGRTVYFHAVYPLHRDELEFKLQHGCDALLDRFAEAGVTECVDVSRPSVVDG